MKNRGGPEWSALQMLAPKAPWSAGASGPALAQGFQGGSFAAEFQDASRILTVPDGNDPPLCNSLLPATIQWSSPTCEARVTARSQGSDVMSRKCEPRNVHARWRALAILTPDSWYGELL